MADDLGAMPSVTSGPVVAPPAPAATHISQPIDGNAEFPLPFREFAKTLVGTEDEVWIHLLRTIASSRNMLLGEWKQLLSDQKNAPL